MTSCKCHVSGPLIPHDGTEDLRKQGWDQPNWTGLLGFTHYFSMLSFLFQAVAFHL